ncbi:MAG TPA: energy transducer TonB [Candidatus Angelobacter sp.]|nr:energy transducer TonB [Candidatus Angelobacter sp.]
MRIFLFPGCVLLLLVAAVLLGAPSVAQNQPAAKPSCIATDEPIYSPGQDGVKPPQPIQDSKKGLKISDEFSIELMVNSEGRVCSARVLKAKDPGTAGEAADYMIDHWKFKPATKQGKPVAVRFTTNFHR